MRIAGAIACLLLLIPSVGSTGRTSASIRPLLGKYWDTAALLPFRRTAYEYASKGQMLEAAKAYERAYREAMRLGDKRSAIRFMNNAGACRLDLLQYREAMSALLLTRKMAEAAGDDKVARTSTLNLSNLYLQMGDLKAAVEAAQRGLGGLPASEFSISRIHALIQLGLIRSRQGDLPASEKLFQDAIAMAERSGEVPALGRAWNHLGYEYLEHNLLNQAEIALGNAHRILSAKTDSETYLCFPNLGRLYLRKGDLKEASNEKPGERRERSNMLWVGLDWLYYCIKDFKKEL